MVNRQLKGDINKFGIRIVELIKISKPFSFPGKPYGLSFGADMKFSVYFRQVGTHGRGADIEFLRNTFVIQAVNQAV